jgi:osmotically inducible protein OsmC
MASESSATTVWEGALATGSGTTSVQSTAIPDVAVSWPARTERTADTTSPEELLAAAHAACYCMGLSHELDQMEHPPERLEATARVTFVAGEGVKSSRIVVAGRVPGVDADGFEKAAQRAGENCPISGALSGNVEITVEATLEE